MWQYRTRYTFYPLAVAIEFAVPQPKAVSRWQWHYRFTDGSELRGQYEFHPSPVPCYRPLGAIAYYPPAGIDPLLQWTPDQVICFELGKERLILASNDNGQGNSLCLVDCPQRHWAQITHWGVQWVAEPFDGQRFKRRCLTPSETWTMGWQLTPGTGPRWHWSFGERVLAKSP